MIMTHAQIASHIELVGDVPDPDDMNIDRALWAERALDAFRGQTGVIPEDRVEQDADLHNLLCDLMHYCDGKGLSFDATLSDARKAYSRETDGEGPQLQGE